VEAGFYRDSEEMPLLGNPAKIELALGWKAKTSLSKIISEMVEHDLDGLQGV
jgi:GDP-D-mannose dehydratase